MGKQKVEEMLKPLFILFLVVFSLSLGSCSNPASGLKSYVDAQDGYRFLYPNGWVRVSLTQAQQGVDVVYHDIIERTANLSVIVSGVPEDKSLIDLGTATDVGYKLLKQSLVSSEREVDLISAETHEVEGQPYYFLEYEVKLPDSQERHNLASVTVNHGKLLTFNISAPQKQWQKAKQIYREVVASFSVY